MMMRPPTGTASPRGYNRPLTETPPPPGGPSGNPWARQVAGEHSESSARRNKTARARATETSRPR